MALTLTLNTKILKNQPSAVGEQVYEGGELHDNGRQVGVFTVINDTFNTLTDAQGLDTAMVDMTLFFFAAHQQHGGQGQGGGGGGKNHAAAAPENMTLRGANEFVGPPSPNQPRQTARAIGSVAAASQTLASHIGKQFVRIGDKLTIG